VNLRRFDTQGRFWTPAWDYRHDQPCTVEAVQLPDGCWHEFERFVSPAEANAVYQAAIRKGLGLAPRSSSHPVGNSQLTKEA
jgi:hypothetical protein